MAGPADNTELAALLVNAQGGGDQGLRGRIFAAVLKATLLVETTRDPESPGGLGLVGVQSSDGRKGIPAFTTRDALLRFKPGAAYIAAIPAKGFFGMAVQAGVDAVLLDLPAPGWEIGREEIAELAEGRVPTSQPAVTQRMVRVQLAAPRPEPPAAELAALKAALEPHAELLAAYVLTLVMAGDAPRLCVGVALRGGPRSYDDVCTLLNERGLTLPDTLGGSEYVTGPLDAAMLEGARKLGVKVFDRT